MKKRLDVRKRIVICLLLLGSLFLTACGQNQKPQKPKETNAVVHEKPKRKEKISFYNAQYIFVNGKNDQMEQRNRKGKLVSKLGKGRVCHVSEKWFYFLEERDQIVTVWRVPLQTGQAADKPIDIKKREKVLSVQGEITGRICVEEPYIIFALDKKMDELYQYDMEKKSVIPCKLQIPYDELGDELSIIEIALEEGCSYVSVVEQGIFKQDLAKGELEAKCIYGIYDGIYSCHSLYAWGEQLYFDHGNYTEPPLETFCIKSYSEATGILWEVSAEDIVEVMNKHFGKSTGNGIKDMKYESVFGSFWEDHGKLYVLADAITYRQGKRKKTISPILSYDPQKGSSSLTYEKELTEFLQKKDRNVFDIIRGKVLVKQKDNAYEFDLSTKKKRILKKSDLNYWYVFGKLK